jgi:hypothetical protein
LKPRGDEPLPMCATTGTCDCGLFKRRDGEHENDTIF